MLWPLLVIPSCHLHRSNLIICPDLYFYFPVATSDADPDLWIRICIIKVGSWSVRRDTNPDLGHTENVQKHAVAKNFNYIFKLDLFLHFYNFLLIFMIFFFFLLLGVSINIFYFKKICLEKLNFGEKIEIWFFPWIRMENFRIPIWICMENFRIRFWIRMENFRIRIWIHMENFRIWIWIRTENFRIQDPDPYNNSYGFTSLVATSHRPNLIRCSDLYLQFPVATSLDQTWSYGLSWNINSQMPPH